MSRLRLAVLCLLAGLVGCMEGQKQDPLLRSSLAERLGGKDKVEAIVADFLVIVKEDQGLEPKLKHLFEEQNTEGLKKQFVELIAGPSSSSERTARDRLRLRPEDFAALAPDLSKALKKNNVGDELRKEVLDLVAPARHKAVE